jgi:hypothetical protein
LHGRGFYAVSSLPVIAILSFVILTGAQRSGEICGSLLKVEPSSPEDRRIQRPVTFVKVSSINLYRGLDSSPGV